MGWSIRKGWRLPIVTLVEGEANLFGLPAMVVGIYSGMWVFKRLSREAFDKLVLAVLLGTVGSLLLRVGETWFLTDAPF